MKTLDLIYLRRWNVRQWLGFVLAWLLSKFSPATYRPACAHCPHWIYHGGSIETLQQADGAVRIQVERIGVCGRDRAKIYNDFTTGYALRAWTDQDHCSRHPLYVHQPIPGSDLEMNPSDDAFKQFGGFNRLPSFEEAFQLSNVARDAKPESTAPVSSGTRVDFVMGNDRVTVKGVDNGPLTPK